MSIYVGGLVWVVGIALVVGGAAVVLRRIGITDREVDNEVAGQVITVIGGLQAVLVAFVLISLFDGAAAARDGSYTEADSLVAAVWAASALPEPARSEAVERARTYLDTVIGEEWPRMRDGRPIGDRSAEELEDLRSAVGTAPAVDEWTIDQKTEATEQLWQVYQARQERLSAATEGGINAVVWFAMVIGGVMSLALPMMFGGPRPASHVVTVSTLAATMTLLLYAAYHLQNPYSGGAEVDPAAFVSALDRLQ